MVRELSWMHFSPHERLVWGLYDTSYWGLVTWGLVPVIGKVGSFRNVELVIVTLFFLGCPLSDVILANDLEIPVEDKVWWLSWLPGEKWICYGAVACLPLCTSLQFVSNGSWELSCIPMGTKVASASNLIGILNFLVFEQICVPEQHENENIETLIIIMKIIWQGFTPLVLRLSLSWHNVLPNNTRQYFFVLCIKLIWYCVMIGFLNIRKT